MGLYAQETTVPVERTQAEIKRECLRYGADSFVLGEEGEKAMVQFRINNRSVRFTLVLPRRDEKRFWRTPGGRRERDESGAWKAWEQACRQKWRALYLFVRASLEATREGIVDFDECFLPYMVLPDGRTVGGHMAPMVKKAIESGSMPRLSLPEPSNGQEVQR